MAKFLGNGVHRVHEPHALARYRYDLLCFRFSPVLRICQFSGCEMIPYFGRVSSGY